MYTDFGKNMPVFGGIQGINHGLQIASVVSSLAMTFICASRMTDHRGRMTVKNA